MEREIGIVCGRCETYAALGTTTCSSCANGLTLEAPAGRGRLPGDPSVRVETIKDSSPFTIELEAVTPHSRSPSPEAMHGLEASLGSRGRISTEDFGVDQPKSGTLVPANGAPPNAAPITVLRLRERDDSPPPVKSSKPKSVEELMDQAKNFVCRSCSTPVPLGHKFCGRCGGAVPVEIMNARTQFFGQLQAPGRAKLILIRGEGVEGLSYQLNAEQHVVGKAGQLVFPDDPFVSPRHANFFYKNGTLCVRDEGSLNGVYVRVRGSVEIAPEDHFLAGEQVFRVDATPKLNDQPGPDGTYFYSSPKHQTPFRITQILHGGPYGIAIVARTSTLRIGREGGDLNFPTDLYMSGQHCKIEDANGTWTLTDTGSRNGTYIRLKAERELGHGDYLFIGRKLLRVEITAA